jgi:catechol 2,3-dioxygenase-like lactoylglutathione lyase family enzyme
MNKLTVLTFVFCSLFFTKKIEAQITVTGYNHVALCVKDLKESTVFYRDVMGFEPLEVPENKRTTRSWFKITAGQELHLLSGRTFPVANNDPNMSHFSLTISDADPVEAYLKKLKMPYLRQQRFDGAWQIFISDPDGYFIELNEPKVAWQNLLNGKDLKGWDTYLGPQFPEKGDDRTGVKPIGLNIDPKQIFTIATEDGESALHISGEHFGGISTVESFENYHFQLQFKWGKRKWHPREKSKMDSGLLYHANGEHGADYGFWMQSQEFQIQEGDCGDYWGVAGAIIDVPTKKINDSTYIYDPLFAESRNPSGSILRTFQDKTPTGRHATKNPDAEKPSGEWNTLDLYCFGDTAVHVVNGKVVMVLYKSKRPVNGKMEALTKGKIQLQSEGSEIFYRRIRILSINALPENVVKK